jgi:CBS domain-containing protein
MRSIEDVMSGPVITVDVEQSVQLAARMMRESETGDVVVMEAGRPVGIVTDRDLAVRVIADDLPTQTPVGEICSVDLVTVAPDDDIQWAAQQMRRNAIRRLPVCVDDRVVGFISLGDLSAHVDAAETLSDISAAPSTDQDGLIGRQGTRPADPVDGLAVDPADRVEPSLSLAADRTGVPSHDRASNAGGTMSETLRSRDTSDS